MQQSVNDMPFDENTCSHLTYKVAGERVEVVEE